MDDVRTQTPALRIAGSISILLPGLAVAVSSILKFVGVPDVLHKMATYGFSGRKLMLVATLEIASAALFLLPRTRSFGLLVFSSFLGGAI